MKKLVILYALVLPFISLCLERGWAGAHRVGPKEPLHKSRMHLDEGAGYEGFRRKASAASAPGARAEEGASGECLTKGDGCSHTGFFSYFNFLHLWLRTHVFKGELGELYQQGHEIIEHHEGRWFNLKQIVLTAVRWRHLQPQNSKWDEHIRNFGFMFAMSHGTEVMTVPLSVVYCLFEGGAMIISAQPVSWTRCASYLTGSLVISNPGTDPLCWLVFAPYFLPYVNKVYRKFITGLRKKSFQFFNTYLIARRLPAEHLAPQWQSLQGAELKGGAATVQATSQTVVPPEIELQGGGQHDADAFMLLPMAAGSLALQRGMVLFFKTQGQHTYLTRIVWPRDVGALSRVQRRQLGLQLRRLGWNASSAVQRVVQQLGKWASESSKREGFRGDRQGEAGRALPRAFHIESIQAVGDMWQVDFKKVLAVRHERKLSLKKLCTRLLRPLDR